MILFHRLQMDLSIILHVSWSGRDVLCNPCMGCQTPPLQLSNTRNLWSRSPTWSSLPVRWSFQPTTAIPAFISLVLNLGIISFPDPAPGWAYLEFELPCQGYHDRLDQGEGLRCSPCADLLLRKRKICKMSIWQWLGKVPGAEAEKVYKKFDSSSCQVGKYK